MSLEGAKTAAVAVAAVLAFTAFLGDARAGFVVKDFSCSAAPFGVNVDISGLGNTNVCIEGSANVNLNCACVGGGDNCPTDTKKQTEPFNLSSGLSVEPKNGRVTTTFSLGFNPTNTLCTSPSPSGQTALSCPSGQTATLISWNIPTGGADFDMCTTTAAAGQPCSCTEAAELADALCGPTGNIVHAGKHGSCAALFP
jgi:hypothetical protein